MEGSFQLHAPASLLSKKNAAGTYWVSSTVGLHAVENNSVEGTIGCHMHGEGVTGFSLFTACADKMGPTDHYVRLLPGTK